MRLICIKGGPITNLEQQEMNTIANEVEKQLGEINIRARISVEFVSYANFAHDFP